MHLSLPLDQIIDTQRFPLDDPGFQAQCRNALDSEGVLSLPGLLLPETLQALVREAEAGEGDRRLLVRAWLRQKAKDRRKQLRRFGGG